MGTPPGRLYGARRGRAVPGPAPASRILAQCNPSERWKARGERDYYYQAQALHDQVLEPADRDHAGKENDDLSSGRLENGVDE